MDPMTFLTGIAAVAAGASAIIAWAARADALRAEERAVAAQKDASDAEKRATAIAEASAQALARANELAQLHFAGRLEFERRQARARWGSLLRAWALSRTKKATLAPGRSLPDTVRTAGIAEVSEGRIALDEPKAVELQAAVHSNIMKMVEEIEALPLPDRQGGLKSMSGRLVEMENLIEVWIADPGGVSKALSEYRARPGQ